MQGNFLFTLVRVIQFPRQSSISCYVFTHTHRANISLKQVQPTSIEFRSNKFPPYVKIVLRSLSSWYIIGHVQLQRANYITIRAHMTMSLKMDLNFILYSTHNCDTSRCIMLAVTSVVSNTDKWTYSCHIRQTISFHVSRMNVTASCTKPHEMYNKVHSPDDQFVGFLQQINLGNGGRLMWEHEECIRECQPGRAS